MNKSREKQPPSTTWRGPPSAIRIGKTLFGGSVKIISQVELEGVEKTTWRNATLQQNLSNIRAVFH